MSLSDGSAISSWPLSQCLIEANSLKGKSFTFKRKHLNGTRHICHSGTDHISCFVPNVSLLVKLRLISEDTWDWYQHPPPDTDLDTQLLTVSAGYLYHIATTAIPQYICINNQRALIKFLFHFSTTLNLYSKHAFHCFSSQKYVRYISVCSLTILIHALLQDANGKITRIKHTFKTDPHSSIICKSLWNINHLGWFQKKACHGTFPIKMCLTSLVSN